MNTPVGSMGRVEASEWFLGMCRALGSRVVLVLGCWLVSSC